MPRTAPKASAHPPFQAMALAAVAGLKSRKPVSAPAVRKYVVAEYSVAEATAGRYLRVALAKLVDEGLLEKVAASYRLTAAGRARAAPKKAKAPKAKAAKAKAAKAPKAKAAASKAAKAKAAAAKAPRAAPAGYQLPAKASYQHMALEGVAGVKHRRGLHSAAAVRAFVKERFAVDEAQYLRHLRAALRKAVDTGLLEQEAASYYMTEAGRAKLFALRRAVVTAEKAEQAEQAEKPKKAAANPKKAAAKPKSKAAAKPKATSVAKPKKAAAKPKSAAKKAKAAAKPKKMIAKKSKSKKASK